MDKLEKHIKQKLQERELPPSEAAWGKIEAQLGVAAEPRSKKIYWYAFAASFIGILLVSVMYFNSSIDKQPIIEVVDTESNVSEEVIIKETDTPKIQVANVEETAVQETMVTPAEKKNAQRFEDPTPSLKDDVLVSNEEVDKPSDKKAIALSEQDLIDDKLHQVLDMVADIEKQNREVTDAEIDSMLMVAQRELLADEVFRNNEKVDAMALLLEVEDELDRTYRGEIFEKLKVGFFKVRTAIADRNN